MRNLAIVVPVYNGADDLPRCLDSLARHHPKNSTVLLVDDASTDPRVRPMLENFARANHGARVLAADENRGFIVTANRGAAEAPADADLVFLNTDTEVTEGWTREMTEALESHEGAAVCCPMSNNATILSVPRFQQPTPLTFGLDPSHMAALVRTSANELQSVPIPTPVGFCMLVKREAWNRWGPFDEAFGRGYGEEDDLGQRIQADGGVVICAPRAFVFHKGAVSFGSSPEVSEDKKRNGELLLKRWPDYNVRTKAWCRENPLREFHERIWKTMLAPKGFGTVHVLHVVSQWGTEGPVRARMLKLVAATRDFAMNTIVVPMPDRGAWMDAIDFEFDTAMRVVGLLEFEKRFGKFLQASDPTVVHFHGTEGVPQALIDRTRDLRPVLVTPADASDPLRSAEIYRRAAAGR